MPENNQLCFITSSDRRFWSEAGPAVLMGEWCKNGHSDSELNLREIYIGTPYGFSIAQRDIDHAIVRALEEKVFVDFCKVINSAHGVNYSSRYWKIVLGQWFRTAISVVFNRVRTIQSCLEIHKPSFVIDPKEDEYLLPRSTSGEALWAYSDPKWDGHFNLRILKIIAPSLQYIQGSEIGQEMEAEGKVNISKWNVKKQILILAWKCTRKFSKYFVRDCDAFIINSYLPRFEEAKLQLYLKQFPQLWRSPEVHFAQEFDFKLRQKLCAQIQIEDVGDIESLFRSVVFEIIPKCYLEGYAHLVRQAEYLPWPKSPKFIFTSNNFGTDELFKVWTAKQVQSGVKYIVGQHGNNYGTHRYMNPSVEEETSDNFISWGWKGGLHQHVPGFNFKIPANTVLRVDPKGDLLLVQVWAGHRVSTWDGSQQFINYMEDQFSFASGLNANVRSLLNVRLHHDWARLDWNEPARWKKFDSDIKLDLGLLNIQDQIRRSRLVVHSYDSTGLLETMALNIPTIAFWQNGLAHLRDEVKEDFQALVDIGIIHLSPKSAAHMVNEIWDDTAAWWGEPKRKKIVKIFCSKYSKMSKNPAIELANCLLHC